MDNPALEKLLYFVHYSCNSSLLFHCDKDMIQYINVPVVPYKVLVKEIKLSSDTYLHIHDRMSQITFDTMLSEC